MATVAASGVSIGANPLAAFPNTHAEVSASWSPPQQPCALRDLRKAVAAEDWERNYSERLTKIQMRAEWAASEERCALLQTIITSNRGRRVLEIGSFCGVAALALAEELPADGAVVSVEQDPFVVELGSRFHKKSLAGSKITTVVGQAQEVLEQLSAQARARLVQPFDFVLIDADKQGMEEYFNILWRSPGLLSDRAIVCIDLTPFKGQPPLRYVKYGFPYRWESDSGLAQIDAMRKQVRESPGFQCYEIAGLLIVQRALE